eukprot:GHUV01017209.1.p1 GENE.GHUV01017209.1~~GHUV01017209.1.p1  ORF type:complete len:274 (+),score=73.30 GHUV01017209.1:394-1215(+)
MANLVVSKGATVHGILHKVTHEHFKILHGIESGYDVTEVEATPYQPQSDDSSREPANGHSPTSTIGNDHSNSRHGPPGSPLSPVTANAFIIHKERLEQLKKLHPDWEQNLLPTERYITIITQGLRHFGADPAWIQHILSQPFKPDKQPSQYLTAPVAGTANELLTWTQQQLSEHIGRVESHKAIIGCGCKVLEVDFSSNAAVPYVDTLRDKMSGRDIAFWLCQVLYDPRLPPLNSPADVQPEHAAFAEDMTMEWSKLQGMTMKQIAWLEKQGQ